MPRGFFLQTDTSNHGVGITLLQQTNPGKDQVIAYDSRTLSQAEKLQHNRKGTSGSGLQNRKNETVHRTI